MTATDAIGSERPTVELSPSAVLPPGQVRVIVAGLAVAVFVALLDTTGVSTALPTIVSDLRGGSHTAWVVTAYILSTTVSGPLWGKLGDQYGRKTFFQLALAPFFLGSVVSGFANSMLVLIVGRGIQGLGGGGIITGVQVIVGVVAAPRDRPRRRPQRSLPLDTPRMKQRLNGHR